MKFQKLLLTLSFIVFGFGLSTIKAQTLDVDTVCAGATGVTYSVTNTSGSTYYWIINGGTQASGSTSNSITVDWATSAGTDTLQVVEMNSSGCYGDTVKLLVYRMPIPTATIAGADTLCINNASSFTVSFTGIGPWDFSYSDGTTTTAVSGVTSSPYTVTTPSLTSTTTYTLTAVSNQFGCTGTTSGSAVITVNPKPSTSAISH